MTEAEVLAGFCSAVREAELRAAAVDQTRLSDPTPCPDWDIRALIEHITVGYLNTVATHTGTPYPDPEADHLGADPIAALIGSLATLSAAAHLQGA